MPGVQRATIPGWPLLDRASAVTPEMSTKPAHNRHTSLQSYEPIGFGYWHSAGSTSISQLLAKQFLTPRFSSLPHEHVQDCPPRGLNQIHDAKELNWT